MSITLANKRSLIVGGSSGIGLLAAKQLVNVVDGGARLI